MSEAKRSWKVVKCPCGHSGCGTYQLEGVGTFYQGCGFKKEDAHLIAAAPDLLDAAKTLLMDAIDRGECFDEETGEMFDDYKALSAAIDKADGV